MITFQPSPKERIEPITSCGKIPGSITLKTFEFLLHCKPLQHQRFLLGLNVTLLELQTGLTRTWLLLKQVVLLALLNVVAQKQQLLKERKQGQERFAIYQRLVLGSFQLFCV